MHDSFFTHAGSVDQLGALLRAEFVALHRRPLLHELERELRALGAQDLQPIPPHGDLDIAAVLDSDYFFS